MLHRTLRRLLQRPDPSLVRLPSRLGPACCSVYRHAVSTQEEHLLWEELYPLMEKDGQVALVGPSKVDEKKTRNISVDLFGHGSFQEIMDFTTMAKRKVPGLVMSPTLVVVAKRLARELRMEEIDSARVVEHIMPGYEMHVESPTTGRQFIYLSLLSDTVVHFDNESTGEKGLVLLPSRSLLRVGGELRWGWRFGERFEEMHDWCGERTIEPSYRFSIQMWAAALGMVDRQKLSDIAHKTVSNALKIGDLEGSTTGTLQSAISDPEKFRRAEEKRARGKGILGGDYVKPPSAEGSIDQQASHAYQYKSDLGRFAKTLQAVETRQEKGEPVTESWLKEQFAMKPDQGPDEWGFDLDDPSGGWDRIVDKASYYRHKISMMKYTDDDQQGSAPSQPKAVAGSQQQQSKGSNSTSNKLQRNIEELEAVAKRLGYTRPINADRMEAAVKHSAGTLPPLPSLPEMMPGNELRIDAVADSGAQRRK